jgi:peptidoglycan/xylan/chitin deacetylase (PgdA/CDA1 family)
MKIADFGFRIADGKRWAGHLVIAAALLCLGAGAGDKSMLTLDHGGIVRGDLSKKRIALIFTGGDYGEGTGHVLDVCKKEDLKVGIFVTGDYLRKKEYEAGIRRAVAEGHYVGPHSDKHPLYCPWEDRGKTLVTEEEFRKDLEKNIADLKGFGALASGPVYFIPPYEWYNEDQVRWAKGMGVTLFNFSPGSGSNRDYMPESEKRFVSSQKIMEDILAYEKKDPHGLNGYILLLHVGADRKDKMFLLLEPLVKELKSRGYSFVRIDQMLAE